MIWILGALAAEPAALVELYTSLRCGACPPADALMAEIVAETKTDPRPIHVVTYHVDLWDRPNGRDPFSDAQWSARQREVVQTLGGSRIYTPQVVVNGARDGVGSNVPLVRALVAGALAGEGSPAAVEGSWTVVDGAIRVEVRAPGAPVGAEIRVVAVEPEQRISWGDRPVTLVNVARGMVRAAAPGGRGELALPKGVSAGDVSLLAWVHDPLTHAVLAVAPLAKAP